MPGVSTNPDFDHVILVDHLDNPLGVEQKLRAHQNGGCLHRAFSIFILNENVEILLQRRAANKYHCPGLWSNSCCSHPREGREMTKEAQTRLKIELGFTTTLEHIGTCIYKEPVDHGLTEWELDHLFVGRYPGECSPSPAEVESVCWSSLDALQQNLALKPQEFTPWLPHILKPFADWFNKSKQRSCVSEI